MKPSLSLPMSIWPRYRYCRLLHDVLTASAASSNAPLSGASRTSRDQNRGEAHVRTDDGTPEDARAGQGGGPQQIDLFERNAGEMIGAPAWLELPAETRNALTSLMARLILEHAGKNQAASKMEASHDV